MMKFDILQRHLKLLIPLKDCKIYLDGRLITYEELEIYPKVEFDKIEFEENIINIYMENSI